jgi:hypothetical protein
VIDGNQGARSYRRENAPQLPINQQALHEGESSMGDYENGGDDSHLRVAHRSFRRHWPAAVLAGVALAGAFVPRVPAAVAFVVVDVVAVADGYRFSKLRGQTIYNSTNETIGQLDDMIIGKDRVLFAIIQVGGFLGIGSRLVAVPYTSLQISQEGRHVVLPGATKEQLKALPEFVYR